MSATKVCKRCGQEKPTDQYSKNRARKDGLQNICKECDSLHTLRWLADNRERRAEYKKQYYAETREQQIERVKQYYADNREHRQEYGRQHQKEYLQTPRGKAVYRNNWHKRRGWILEGDMTPEQIEQVLASKTHCPHCGREFGPELPPTLDHIVPKGLGGAHTLSNCQPLCDSCNKSKRDRFIG